MAKTPTSFKDLPVAELRRSAIADFAVDVKETDNKETVIAALFEGGVTWGDYVAQHPEVEPEVPQDVITAKPVEQEVLVKAPERTVVTASAPVYNPGDVLLVKMERENPRFDVRGHTFTQTHPYSLMSPEDASWLFRNEEGFRQAYPDELQEYYG